jgi:hypothetical protein
MKNAITQQFAFAQDLMKLYQHIVSKGLFYTLGESWRPDWVEQKYREMGLSKTIKTSPHGDRLAQDLNIFRANYQPITTVKDLQEIGAYWKSLNPLNIWGGDWKDPIDPLHFQRKAVN